MLPNVIAFIPGCPGSGRVFLAVAVTVSALVFGVRTIGSFSAPSVYASTVRIKLLPNAGNNGEVISGPHEAGYCDSRLMQTECEVLRSELILAQVVNVLGSNQTPGKKQLGTEEGTGIPDRIAQLEKRIKVRPVQDTNLIDICVLGENPEEAAQIANALAETYRAYQGNLLKVVPPPVSSPLRAEVMGRALPMRRPVEPNNLPGIAREALGAILLGVAAGSLVVMVGCRRKPLMPADVLPSVFVIVFFVVLGVGALKCSANFAVTTAAGLLLAFMVGGAADWFMFLRRKYPEAPNTFPAVFVIVFLLVVCLGVLDTALSTKWYCSAVRLRLGLATPDRAGLGTAPVGYAVHDPQLIKTQCDVIRSEDTLRPVIEDLDLNRQWGKRYSYGTSLQTSWTLALLKRRIEVRRIPDTCLIEIRVHSEKAEEAARLANALWETYRDHRRDHLAASPQGPAVIQAEVLDHAVPAASPMGHQELQQLASYALTGLCLAFAAGGGAVWVVSELLKAQSRKLLGP